LPFQSLLLGLATALGAGDFESWHVRQSPVTNVALRAVAYGMGQFVAVGGGGTILTSPDGNNWTRRVSSTTQTLQGVVANSESFVAVGDGGTTLSSSDGIDWTVQTVPELPGHSALHFRSVTYGNGVFVAVGPYTYKFYSSPDGKTWNPVKYTQGGPAPVYVSSVNYCNGLFVAVGEAELYTSSDGTNWSVRFVPHLGGAFAVTFGAGQFVAVGGVTHPRYATMFTWASTNAVIWPTPQRIGNTLTYLSSVTFGGGLYFALGAIYTINYRQAFLSSSDGLHWTEGEFPSPMTLMRLNSAAFGDGTFIVVGDNGTILQSEIIVPTPAPTVEPHLGILPGAPITISIRGSAGDHLRMEYRDDFAAGTNTWQALDTISLDGASAFWSDTNAPAARRFYRAIVLP